MRRLASFLKWFYPGMRVKRWLLLVLAGVLFNAFGIVLFLGRDVLFILDRFGDLVYSATGQFLPGFPRAAGLCLISGGVTAIFVGIRQIVHSITSAINPHSQTPIADLLYQRRCLAQGERITALGGGTGLSTILRGLKEVTSNITAIVTVTDDGGSSGRLMREYNILPPGDIRNCLTALADAEPLMTQLLQYRFRGDREGGLNGHSFGNLFLTALSQIMGDFELAIRETSRVLAIRGRVLPSTLDRVWLLAELQDGRKVCGETAIVESAKRSPIQRLYLEPEEARALPEAVEAIYRAAVVVVGPGSLYTSVLPNLLLPEIAEALEETEAIRVYICNVMTQPGETDHFTASDHLKVLIEHTGKKLFDYVLVNTQKPSEEVLNRYAQEGACWVQPDIDKIRQMGYRVITGNFMSETNVVRHNPQAVTQAILRIIR